MKTKLLNLVSSRKGKMPSAFSQTEKAGYLPYIDIKLFDKGILSRYAKADKKATLVNKQDVLVVWDGARFGLSALGWEGVLGSTIVALQSDYLISQFLYYFLQLNFETIQAKPRGVGIPHVEPSLFWNLPIPVPPMAEQKRIVKKIEELFGVIDRDIQRLTDTLEQLSQFRQSVLEKLLNSHIPNSTLGELLQPRRERIIPSLKNQEMPYVGLDSIEPGALTLSKIETLQQTKSSCFLFCKDDVLYGRMRSYLNKVFKADFKGAASAEFIVFPKSEKILPDYLKYLLHQHRFVVFATKNSSGDRPRVKFEEDLAPFHFYLPTLPEQQKIVDEIEKAFRSTDKVQKAVQNALEEAKKLKQSILKKAFAGELIPQDPNDKPVNLPVLKGQTK